jgi:putative ATP-binding cassette transporter
MKAIRFFIRSIGRTQLLIAPLGLVGSAFGVGFVAIIHRALASGTASRDLILAFVGFGLGRVIATYFSGLVLGSHAQEAIMELRRKLIARVLCVPYRNVEKLGSANVHAVMTHDVSTLGRALENIPVLLINVALLLGAAAYLAYLSPLALAGACALAVPSVLIYRFMSKHARKSLALQREQYEQLHGLLSSLTHGVKELKLHQPRRRSFLTDGLLETTETLLDYEHEGRSRYLLGQAVNQVLFFAMLGAVLFVFPLSAAGQPGVTTGYVLIGLFMLAPLTQVARMLPMFHASEIAIERIEELGVRLGERLAETGAEPDADPGLRPSLGSIQLRDVAYRYDDERSFVLGPINLTLHPGELVFITGGNGSGKSTLARVLTGLYGPTEGELIWDGEVVTAERRDTYRQLWSGLFSELQLFDRLYGLFGMRNEAQARSLLQRLGLARIVHVENGKLSTHNLSRGQQKRLALLVGLLEDRPVYLFDEWAADQDPEFRRTFYRELLPELRGQGKAVVVITHDDRYFDAADRIIQLQEGRVIEESDSSVRAVLEA